MAANDRAAAPGKSGGSSGADGLMRASLSAVAPGTALRDGLERILRGNTGGLIVLGSDKTVEAMCTGGFVLDVEFTATRLRELCKLDGGNAARAATGGAGPGPQRPAPHRLGLQRRGA